MSAQPCNSMATNSSKGGFGSTTRRASPVFLSMVFGPSVSRAHVDQAHLGSRDILYHVAWERTPAFSRPSPQEPVPLGRLQEVAREAFEQVIATRGRDKLQASMAACDDLAAAHLARGLREMSSGLASNGLITATSLRVAEPMRPVFERLLDRLAQRGLLEKRLYGLSDNSGF